MQCHWWLGEGVAIRLQRAKPQLVVSRSDRFSCINGGIKGGGCKARFFSWSISPFSFVALCVRNLINCCDRSEQ